MKILFLSHTYWDSKFRVGSHQLANQYLKNGHEVYYISSPLSFFHLLKNDYDIKKRFKTRFPRKKIIYLHIYHLDLYHLKISFFLGI